MVMLIPTVVQLLTVHPQILQCDQHMLQGKQHAPQQHVHRQQCMHTAAACSNKDAPHDNSRTHMTQSSHLSLNGHNPQCIHVNRSICILHSLL